MHRRGGSVVERSPHIREIGVQSQVVVKTDGVSCTVKRSATDVRVNGSSEITIING